MQTVVLVVVKSVLVEQDGTPIVHKASSLFYKVEYLSRQCSPWCLGKFYS